MTLVIFMPAHMVCRYASIPGQACTLGEGILFDGEHPKVERLMQSRAIWVQVVILAAIIEYALGQHAACYLRQLEVGLGRMHGIGDGI
jgi:hypothetical protein